MELYEGVLEDDVGRKCDIDEVRLAFNTQTRSSVILHDDTQILTYKISNLHE